MNINVELEPRIAELLQAEAARRGMSAEECAFRILELMLAPGLALERRLREERLTDEEWEREVAEFEKECEDIDAPDFPDEVLRREHLYEDRGL